MASQGSVVGCSTKRGSLTSLGVRLSKVASRLSALHVPRETSQAGRRWLFHRWPRAAPHGPVICLAVVPSLLERRCVFVASMFHVEPRPAGPSSLGLGSAPLKTSSSQRGQLPYCGGVLCRPVPAVEASLDPSDVHQVHGHCSRRGWGCNSARVARLVIVSPGKFAEYWQFAASFGGATPAFPWESESRLRLGVAAYMAQISHDCFSPLAAPLRFRSGKGRALVRASFVLAAWITRIL